MKRWDGRVNDRVEDPQVDAFLEEVIEVCRKHGMSLGHEDGHGNFIVHKSVIEFNLDWLRGAAIDGER